MNLSNHDGKIQIPLSSSFLLGGSAHCQVQNHSIALNTLPPPRPTSESPTPLSSCSPRNSNKRVQAKYRECLKNHAASIGGNATDGCGEFMPSGAEGTLEALKCSACHCHRNFHRKEHEGLSSSLFDCIQLNGGYIARTSPHQMIMPLGSLQSYESDEIYPIVKKRFRTKFSVEQKEKMLTFAEKVGWKLHKQNENMVQQICQEIGVKRRVLKVWMHNNKHSSAKKGRNLELDWRTSASTAATEI